MHDVLFYELEEVKLINIDIGIDLGTSNTVIYVKDKGIVVNQPSVVAYDERAKKVIAVGNKAKKMLGKTPEGIIVVRPIRNGVISDYTLTERMIKLFVKTAMEKRRVLGRPNVCVSVPSGATPVQIRAVEDAVYRTGAKNVYVLQEPFAAAIGAGIRVDSHKGCMVVDIGGGTTDIAVISKGGIQIDSSIKIAGEDFDEAIIRYLRKRHNILIGDVSAEALKYEIGTVYPRKKDAFGYAKGKELVRGLPVKMQIKSSEIEEAVSEVATQIVDAVRITLEGTLPELLSDIAEQGILLTGGGSKIYGMDKLIYEKTGVKTMRIENPEYLVAKGAGTASKYVRLRED